VIAQPEAPVGQRRRNLVSEHALSSTNQGHDLEPVSIDQGPPAVNTSRHKLEIDLDGHLSWVQVQQFK
jgi:hypothetical protein